MREIHGITVGSSKSAERPRRRENPLVFYPKVAGEILLKAGRYARMILSAYRIYRKVERDPARASYTDLAITPVREDDLETLAMFTETSGGEAAVAKKRRADDLRAKVANLQAAE